MSNQDFGSLPSFLPSADSHGWGKHALHGEHVSEQKHGSTDKCKIIYSRHRGFPRFKKAKSALSFLLKVRKCAQKRSKSAKMRDPLLTLVVTQNWVVCRRTNQNATCRPDHLVLWTSLITYSGPGIYIVTYEHFQSTIGLQHLEAL